MAEKEFHESKGIQTAPASFSCPAQHLRLTQVVLADITDRHNELVQERRWLLHPSESLELQGNLFVIEDLAGKSGKILVKQSPLPDSRPEPAKIDLRVSPQKGSGFNFELAAGNDTGCNDWTMLEYSGGVLQQIRTMHEWQRMHRSMAQKCRPPRFLVNTWGDRSQDSRICQAFIDKEIPAARRLGADVLQLDDGWQKGISSNSVYANSAGGLQKGFWDADPGYWDPHPDRFSQGLQPVADRARSMDMEIGLWFVPDPANDYSNWRRDADRILELYSTLGVIHFKIDGVKAPTHAALGNLKRFFRTALEKSNGEIVFDLDITAGVRPGYFGAMDVGPLFVENRYTDWHNYWPHHTLRNLWKLSRWIDPGRLRMEFLNNNRNDDKYPDDPLAPSRYEPAALFATVMFSNPLGWFEASNLPDSYVESVSGLVGIWKKHREGIFAGTIAPVGREPDGFSYTGFISIANDNQTGYALIFRGLHEKDRMSIPLPFAMPAKCDWEVLAPEGRIETNNNALAVNIPQQTGFLFARFNSA